tara:strand:+ start:198 stop:512 length:315 start_codon:yes stop_codon:yes gene_type:complete
MTEKQVYIFKNKDNNFDEFLNKITRDHNYTDNNLYIDISQIKGTFYLKEFKNIISQIISNKTKIKNNFLKIIMYKKKGNSYEKIIKNSCKLLNYFINYEIIDKE